jgi:predicted bacteriocin transport accessory protein
MRKLLSILSVFALVFVLVGCGSNSVREVNPNDVQNKIDEGESFILVVSTTTCPFCEDFKPIMVEFSETDATTEIIEIFIDNQDEAERNAFVTRYNIAATPTTLFFRDGQLVNQVSRVLSLTELENMYHEFIIQE